ncbi:hypothetical protein [Microbacterium sp. Root180]|uniref:hypothetical protein n=1 Tax=Microbacterium sp. Root180 TaxID=1736483 RepID=UPI0007004E78|nr:hypothetical protein [Microbacterium sp. Root180]KRB36081.1 hypothetical protein ASD93_08150 [Microbacterium sp. Root180]
MNAELTPRELSDMRDALRAGAQRLHPAGQRRMQIIAASVAFVLVAGIGGAAVATASLVGLGIDRGTLATPSETPRPTPTLSPTPEPTPPAPPAQGVLPFGGECENALDEAAVEAVSGIDMMLSDYRWRTGADDVLGGIDCVWVSDGVYLAAITHLHAYPDSVVGNDLREGTPTGCVGVEGGMECTEAGSVDGTWLVVRSFGSEVAVTEAAVEGLFTAASERLAEHPAASPATRTPQWWRLADCQGLAASIDPAVYGFERVALLAQSSRGEPTEQMEGIALFAEATNWCDLHFTSGSGDAISGEVVRIGVVPGGAITFQTALDAADARAVSVDGAQGAVIVPGLNRYEGSESVVVVTDGVNILTLTPDFSRDAAEAAPLAAAVLGMMHP